MPACLQLVDQLLQAGLERLLRNAAGVVAADLDDDDRRLLGDHVLVDALEQVGHGVPAGGDPVDLDVLVLVRLLQRLAHDPHVALGDVLLRLFLARPAP